MYETLPLLRVISFALPFINSVKVILAMPRSFAYWGTPDSVCDQLRALTPLQQEKAHMILTEWKGVLTPDSIWTFSRK
jgi:hypothetical protein